MDTNPLPNNNSDFSDSGSEVSFGYMDQEHYFVRVARYGRFAPDDLYDFIDQSPDIQRYVIGREDAGLESEHFHIVLTPHIPDETQVRTLIKSFLDPRWEDENHKLPRGYGNKQYNCQLVQDIDTTISYTCKMMEYRYRGWQDSYIRERAAASFEKKKKVTFKTKYLDLCKRFQEHFIEGIEDFMIEFVTLKAEFGQQVNLAHAKGFAISNAVKRNPELAAIYVKNYLSTN